MLNFRAYVIGPDGSFLRAHNFQAISDEEAVSRAESFASEHPVELWEGERLVKRLEIKKNPARSRVLKEG